MITLEGFVRICAEHIEKREPFLAYWHTHGFGLLRTEKVEYQEYRVHAEYPRVSSLGPRTIHETTTNERRVESLRRLVMRTHGELEVKACKKSKKAKVSTIETMHKLIGQMRGDIRISGLHVVEYSGDGIITEGGDALHALRAIQLPSDSDAARP